MLPRLSETALAVKLAVFELLLLTFIPILNGTVIAYHTFESKPRKAVRTCGYSFVITSFVVSVAAGKSGGQHWSFVIDCDSRTRAGCDKPVQQSPPPGAVATEAQHGRRAFATAERAALALIAIHAPTRWCDRMPAGHSERAPIGRDDAAGAVRPPAGAQHSPRVGFRLTGSVKVVGTEIQDIAADPKAPVECTTRALADLEFRVLLFHRSIDSHRKVR